MVVMIVNGYSIPLDGNNVLTPVVDDKFKRDLKIEVDGHQFKEDNPAKTKDK